MSNTLYLECYSGISGDMTVAALLDLGADQEVLMRAIGSLGIDGYEIRISRVKKSGIDACDFNVMLEQDNHDHDMEYLHGHEHSHDGHEHSHDDHEHSHDDHEHSYDGHEHGHDDHEHSHDGHEHNHCGHDHGQGEDHMHHHGHEHRNLQDVMQIIGRAKITDRARATAGRIFEIIAQAEAKAHGVPISEVHFHEVGAIDSIIDVLSVAVCLDNLGIENVIVPRLNEGQGFVRCQHGMIPVPVPAVANIAQAYGLPLNITDTQGELVTPTGAAIVAAVCTSDRLPDNFTIEKTGIGAGKRNYDRPGMLRAMLIRDRTQKQDSVYKLETNIDDCTGEMLGYVMERLLAAGARDVHYMPVFMKKNRPAYQLNVICDEALAPTMEEIIFAETTTIGIRRQRMERSVLKREEKTIRTGLGEVQVKVCEAGGMRRCYPEYESVVRLCREKGMSYPDAFWYVEQAAKEAVKDETDVTVEPV